jgi:hypothetical protein
MRLAFLLLLLANLALFAWQQGTLGSPADGGREPQRLARQVAPERIRLLTPDQLAALRSGPTAPASEAAARPGCIEFGDFDDATVARVQPRLAELGLGERLRVRRVDPAVLYVVHLPAPESRAEAERVAQDLVARGLRDVIVAGPNSPLPNAVLLGSFRDLEQARRHQAEMTRRGLKEAQISERASGARVSRFEIGQADAGLARQLAEIQKEFPQSQIGACGN